MPGVWLKVSQIEGPRPSSLTAPSIWYDAVATPQTKSSGKVDCAIKSSCVVLGNSTRIHTDIHGFSIGLSVSRCVLSKSVRRGIAHGYTRIHRIHTGFLLIYPCPAVCSLKEGCPHL